MQEMLSCGADNNCQGKGFLTPPVTWRSNRNVPAMPGSEKKPRRSPQARAADLFHVIHKVPAGDSPYVRAKHVQLIEKDPSRAISLFWSAINSGDRVDSALKDMAVVMKQLNRSDEAIEAIKSFRHLCPAESHESLDNVLIELYKKSGRIEDEIEMLQLKLRQIEEGIAFGGKHTKMARSQGKKVNTTIEKEYSRLLGNLAWAYVQQKDYKSAEEFYRKALSLEPDKNKQCNLAICLMHMNKITEARFLLRAIKLSAENKEMDESYAKSYERAAQMMDEIQSQSTLKPETEEKENGKEVETPVTKWNFRELSSPCGEDQIKACRSVTLRSFSDGNKDRKLPLAKWNRGSSNWMEMGSACKNSPCPAGLPRVPYTQPRRSSWSLQNGDQSKGWLKERAIGNCNRKLSFEQPTNNKNMQFITGMCPNRNSDDWRKRWNNCAKESGEQSTFNSAAQDYRLPSYSLSLGTNTGESKQPEQKLDQNSVILTTENGGLKEIAEHALESLKSMQQLDAANPNPLDFSTDKCKKSWADMVDEEEKELQNAISNFAHQERASRYMELFESHQIIRSQSSYGLQDTEEQNDENTDSNIIFGSPVPLRQPKNETGEIQSSDLKGCGYYTQPAASQAVRRSLCFDKDQKPDQADTHCRSPLEKKALDFDSNASMLSDGCNIPKLLRRNRLQVFRDITPESPRP